MIATARPTGHFRVSELGDASTEFYRENGFLVVTDGVSSGEVAELRNEAVAICRGERGDVFNGWHFDGKAVDAESAQEAFATMSDDEVIRNFLCIHQAHQISEVMYRYLAHPSIVKTLTGVIGPNVKCMQSMLFIKSAGKPGQAWHQDEDYIPTRDRSLAGAWIAMDDATVENGCLWVIPGSHQRGILWPQYPHDDERFDCASMSYGYPYDDDRDAIPVEVPAGAIVFFNGYLLHRSLPNRAKGGFRRVLVNHYMSAESFLPWGGTSQDGPRTAIAQYDVRRVIMIAGEDPYAWKGYETGQGAHVRPDGQGGCGDGRTNLADFLEKRGLEAPA